MKCSSCFRLCSFEDCIFITIILHDYIQLILFFFGGGVGRAIFLPDLDCIIEYEKASLIPCSGI